MSFEKIISIPGMSGLYKMLAQMRNGGFVVESLNDGKRVPVSATQRIIMLSDISVYTVEDDIPLREVFLKMKDNEKAVASMDSKTDPDKLKDTLKKILPDFDEERVHASDIRKMFIWFNLLKDQVDFTETSEEEKAVEASEVKEEKKVAKKTEKKADKKEEEKEPAPAKKVAAKKTVKKKEAEEESPAPAKKAAAKKTAAKKK